MKTASTHSGLGRSAVLLISLCSFLAPVNSFSQVGLGIDASTPATKLDVNGDIALRIGSYTAVNGNNNNISVGSWSFVSITGPTANFTITGIAGGVNGKMLILYNNTNFDMVIAHQSASSTASNRIICGDSMNRTMKEHGCATLIYSTTDSRWILVTRD